MRVITWNIQGWTEDKAPAVNRLLHKCELLCLTEIWSLPSPDLIDGHIYAVQAPHTPGLPRRTDGVALVAAQRYYFGVGGSTTAFLELVAADGELAGEVVREFDDGASNIRELLRIRWSK